jgi:hypothetical protein
VSAADDILQKALTGLPARPSATEKGKQATHDRKRYSELMSQALALALGEILRQRGLERARPGGMGDVGKTGAERTMSGGIGAKKVDVTWATEEAGLLLAVSIKTINFGGAKSLQKNLTNRRGDMLFEAVTLHRRFPYAALGGIFILDKSARADDTDKRASTFENAHRKLKLFTGRSDPAGRDEQFERLYVGLVDASPFSSTLEIYEAGKPKTALTIDQALDPLLRIVSERDPDSYVLLGPDGRSEPPDDASPVSLRAARKSVKGAMKAAETQEAELDGEDDESEE